MFVIIPLLCETQEKWSQRANMTFQHLVKIKERVKGVKQIKWMSYNVVQNSYFVLMSLHAVIWGGAIWLGSNKDR